ncbi:hypothetical protein PM082_021447 [Marasmius tenuissimus]|nr:hypothetical protein PM082_021447 [Marasmius tenuissimus]
MATLEIPQVGHLAGQPLQLWPHFHLIPANIVVSATLLVYDYFCTLDEEVVYVWSRPWSFGSIIFLFNRYLPFIDTFLSIDVFFGRPNPKECLARTTTIVWLMYVGIAFSEIILILRTYALWERKRSILLVLGSTTMIAIISGAICLQKQNESLVFAPTMGPGCHIIKADNIAFISYIVLLFTETIIAVLTLVKGYHDLRRTRSPWVVQLYQHGILFYVYLLALSLGNILTGVINPRMGTWLASPQRVLHSLLSSRVLIVMFSGQPASEGMSQRTPAFSLTSSAIVSADLMPFDDDETVSTDSPRWSRSRTRIRNPR